MAYSDLEKLVRRSHDVGSEPWADRCGGSSGVSSLEAVKTLRRAAGIPVDESLVVDNSLPAEWRLASERLLDGAGTAMLREAPRELAEFRPTHGFFWP